MKNLFGKILIVMLVISACEGPMGPAGRDGIDGEVTYWKIIDFRVRRDQWLQIGDNDEIGSYLYFYLEDDQISQEIYDNGLVLCYYKFTDEFGLDVQSPLPFTVYDIDVEVFEEDIYEYPYSIHFSYDVTPGSIAIKVVISNFFTNAYWHVMPTACDFRLHLLL